jgi:integrase
MQKHNFNTVNVSEMTPFVARPTRVPTLDPAVLDAAAAHAAEEFVIEGTPPNTARSYASALRYWAAWYALRYGKVFGEQPVSVAVASQFVLDHLERKSKDGLRVELPTEIDARLVEIGAKAKLGPLTHATVSHRLAVLAKWHRLKSWDSPTDDHRLKTLMAKARRAQARRGISVHKKTALVAEPLQAILATCNDGLRGIRDCALLLLAWSGGGRRRSEVVGLQVQDLRRIDATTWVYALGPTKTDVTGVRREKPLRGDAIVAIEAWLDAAKLAEGPLFRRLHRNGRVGAKAMTADHVARMVKRRARLAGVEGDWAGHSLRSGFVTEAGRQGVPLGEVMAMTEHRSVGTVLGYFQAGNLLGGRSTDLLRRSSS